MILGDICPACKSKEVVQNSMSYLNDEKYINGVSKVYVEWTCNKCKAIYKVVYHGERYTVIPYNDKIESNDEKLRYEEDL